MLFIAGYLLVIRRDEFSHIPWPGMWDLPGGAREGRESPEECALRETREEVALTLSAQDLVWRRFYQSPVRAWFFAAHLDAEFETKITLGNEGQEWALMAPQDFISNPEAVPHFRERVKAYLGSL